MRLAIGMEALVLRPTWFYERRTTTMTSIFSACSALVNAGRNDGRNRAYPARRLLSAAIPKSRASTAAKAAALRFPTGLIFFAR